MHRTLRWKMLVLQAAIVLPALSCGGGGSGNGIAIRQLVSLAIQPTTAQAVGPGGTFPFLAIGTFNASPSTGMVNAQWISSDPSIATVDSTTGVALCSSSLGTVTITASALANGHAVQGSATFSCVSLTPPPTMAGVCIATMGVTNTLTGACVGHVNGVCRATEDLVNCPKGAKTLDPQLIFPCGFPNFQPIEVDHGRSCNP